MGGFEAICDGCGEDKIIRESDVCEICGDKKCEDCSDRYSCYKCGMELCQDCSDEHAKTCTVVPKNMHCCSKN